jgi:tRNA-Thr(GGU) m(6)t(6)A37 methyltransferase TsaA
MEQYFNIEQIGIIHTPIKTKDDCPIQGRFSSYKGKIEIFSQYKDGLETIETFSHIYLFYLFNQAGEVLLSRPTFLDDQKHGVFASRHPCRPNGIGMSIVELDQVNGGTLIVNGIDILDQTPLIDIKPYIPRFDLFKDASNGWVEGLKDRSKPNDRE